MHENDEKIEAHDKKVLAEANEVPKNGDETRLST